MKPTSNKPPLFILQTAKDRGISGVQTILSSNLAALNRPVVLYYFGKPVLTLFTSPNILLKAHTLQKFLKLLFELFKGRYASIITQGPIPIDSLFLIVGLITETPVIVHRHVIQKDLQWKPAKNKCFFWLDKFTLHLAHKILYSTKSACELNQTIYALKNGGVITNGIEIAKHPPKITVKRVAMVAQLQSHKGWDLYLQAIQVLSQKHPHIEFLGFGDGPLKTTLLPKFAALKNFKWMENKVPMAPYYKDIDVLVLPSNREGLSFACVEGLSYGCVLVITPVKGSEELLANKNGTLIPFEDSMALAQGIEQYILNPILFSEQSKKSIELAHNSFNLITVAKQLNQILDEVES